MEARKLHSKGLFSTLKRLKNSHINCMHVSLAKKGK